MSASAQRVTLSGRIVDSKGAGVGSAQIDVTNLAGGQGASVQTDIDGSFRVSLTSTGEYELSVKGRGLAPRKQRVTVAAANVEAIEIQLEPAVLAQQIFVSANLIAGASEDIDKIPGSVEVLDAATLRDSRLFTFDEALRKISGVYARPEEGFGLRPNIGIRGINPTRSARVLLLEDGVPLAYAPYGDNASYYHPPIDRFDGVEVVKGSGQVLYGPMTVGGVVNYVTPPIPDRQSGSIAITGGNRDYLNAHGRWGGTFNGVGMLLDGVRKQGEGARDNIRSGINDINFKLNAPLSATQMVALKINHYDEDSRVTYSGLTLDEWQAAPRSNPFRNDSFITQRTGLSGTHSAALTPNAVLSTNLYYSRFTRDWWRQSSNSGQRPNRINTPGCAGMVDLHTGCGNEGRLREYQTWGFDPKLKVNHSWLGIRQETDIGFRGHFEFQNRIQMNGNAPLARTGTVVEDNRRTTQGWSGFVQNRMFLGNFVISPGVRLEHVRFDRTNRLFAGGAGVFGKADLTQVIPGIGVSYSPNQRVTFFSGVHRGFAPPRAEDIISNSGGFVELDPELSWNYEAGVRTRPANNFTLDATWFRMDYQNQIIPASLAGGVGAVLTSAGETVHQGMEASGRYDFRNVLGTGNSLYLRGAHTWLPTARFEGVRFSGVSGFGNVLVTGNRLPYASEYLSTTSLGFLHRRGVHAFIEAVHTGRQFGDDLNTVNSTPNGQRGVIPGNVLWNATLNVPLEAQRTTLFITAKNLTDRTVIVDRVRGILPNSPRLIQAGFRFDF
ncbi:MAG: TonB-dependent receptor [Bryobacterales bacterium]|nr:TonB-dependent receptor [Bryobacterales bacterium]